MQNGNTSGWNIILTLLENIVSNVQIGCKCLQLIEYESFKVFYETRRCLQLEIFNVQEMPHRIYSFKNPCKDFIELFYHNVCIKYTCSWLYLPLYHIFLDQNHHFQKNMYGFPIFLPFCGARKIIDHHNCYLNSFLLNLWIFRCSLITL